MDPQESPREPKAQRATGAKGSNRSQPLIIYDNPVHMEGLSWHRAFEGVENV